MSPALASANVAGGGPVAPVVTVTVSPPTQSGNTPIGAAPSAPSIDAGIYTVVKGDWLGHIAERYLGDFDRYPEIAQLNPHLINDHDHIEPTWNLTLPRDARDRGPQNHATGSAIDESPIGAPDPAPIASERGPAGASDGEIGEAPGPGPTMLHTSPPATSTPSPPSTPGAPAGTSDATAPLSFDAGDITEEADMDKVAIAFGAASLLTALALAALLALRRRARQKHVAGRRPVNPDEGKIETELRVAQEPLDVERLEGALRSLAASLADHDGVLPDPFGAVVDGGNVWLLLAEFCPAPPEPWVDHGKSWLLPAGADVPAAAGQIAPLPTLAAIGWQDATHLLLDLERIGLVHVRGDLPARGHLILSLRSTRGPTT
jgi:hypothetical protein